MVSCNMLQDLYTCLFQNLFGEWIYLYTAVFQKRVPNKKTGQYRDNVQGNPFSTFPLW